MSVGNLLRQELTIYGKGSYDSYGRPSLGAGVDVWGRFQPKQKRQLMPDGDVLVIDALAYVPNDTTVKTDDRVSYDSTNYKVVGVYKTPDGKGNTKFIRLELVKFK